MAHKAPDSFLSPADFLDINRVSVCALRADEAEDADAEERERRLKEEFSDVFAETLSEAPD